MKKSRVLLCLLLAAATLLCACGKKGGGEQAADTPDYSIPDIQPSSVPSTPKISDKYNSIDDANKREAKEVREQLLAVAEGCRDIYEQADKGTAINVVLSDATVQAMVVRIGQMGYSAVDYLGTMDMQCPDPIVFFGSTIGTAEDTSVSYYMVYSDGQISVYHLGRSSGMWYLIAMSAVWDKECNPSILTEGRYVIGSVSYTDKGWLIYNRDTESFDDNQRSNTNAYVFVRVLPYDSTKRALSAKYIEPIGYFENNLFTTTWTEANLGVIDFNSLYAYLFGMYHGTASLSAANARGCALCRRIPLKTSCSTISISTPVCSRISRTTAPASAVISSCRIQRTRTTLYPTRRSRRSRITGITATARSPCAWTRATSGTARTGPFRMRSQCVRMAPAASNTSQIRSLPTRTASSQPASSPVSSISSAQRHSTDKRIY